MNNEDEKWWDDEYPDVEDFAAAADDAVTKENFPDWADWVEPEAEEEEVEDEG